VSATAPGPTVIAIDLGGTQIRAARVSASGDVSHRVALQSQAQAGPSTVMAQLAEAARTAAGDLPTSAILGIGMSSPGPLDTTRGIAISLPTIAGFENFPIVDDLQSRLGHRMWLENDGISAAIGYRQHRHWWRHYC
jgi:glucokinase